MNSNRRVVFDTNVVVSAALLPRSLPRQALDRALRENAVLVSISTLFELEDVLRRPKFIKYVSELEREEFLAALINHAQVVEVRDPIQACRDPKDDKFLEVAVSGRATHLISGDDDLLCLHPFRGIAILTPHDFLNIAD